jgi:phosphoribosylformylglycinamidine cyclo-ligase
MAMVENLDIHGLVHITGGGLIENVPRILPENLSAQFDRRAWDVPAVFPLIQKWGNVEEMEMYKVFNMGIGMCVIVDQKDAEALKAVLTQNNEPYFVIGEIVKGNKTVLFREA